MQAPPVGPVGSLLLVGGATLGAVLRSAHGGIPIGPLTEGATGGLLLRLLGGLRGLRLTQLRRRRLLHLSALVAHLDGAVASGGRVREALLVDGGMYVNLQ